MMFKQGDRLINSRNWSELVKPEQVARTSDPADASYGRFVCEPLERGYGTTIGNALRRILLSSLQGAAFVSVKISGVQHEFTTIPGVLEDVTDIVLNLKQVRMVMDTDEPQRVFLKVSKAGVVSAENLICTQHVRVINPELHLFTITDPCDVEMELDVRMGKGYVPADMQDGLTEDIGLIALDASYAPVRKVSYTVEQARVGQMTNYDRLIIEVWTDGSITPDDAVAYSAKILKDQLSVFINFDEHISGETPSGGAGGG
ncbi:MAG: DNA-directed RNA polymerase subunit alpha, partial [Desulfovibrio sp.]|nr:DNA-directed RNA polymerase subunit alpha [Desulfovibrio sp.]